MNKFMQKMSVTLSSLMVTIMVSLPVVADDIEIYKKDNLGTASVWPNIMFILDTSGSMGASLIVQEDYDPLVDYDQRTSPCTGQPFDDSYFYVNEITVSDSDIDCSYTNGRKFLLSQLQCQAANNAFAVTGFYSAARFSQWQANQNVWTTLTNSNNANYYIECNIDQGNHGIGNAETYISGDPINSASGPSGSGPYSTDSTGSELSWGTSGVPSENLKLRTGNYMNYLMTSADVVSTRMDVMRDVIENLVFSVDGVNVGLMRFDNKNNQYEGGSVRYQVQDVDASRNNMRAEMNTWTAEGATPLSETLYEAYLYFSGGEVYYGRNSQPPSVGESKLNGSLNAHYASPVDPDFSECQRQFIIYLSDGDPTWDTSAETLIEALPGFISTDGASNSDCTGSGSGSCLDDLAGYMNNHGIDAFVWDPATSSAKTIENVKVTTYTVGIGSDIDSLRETAEAGGGEYFVTHGSSDLMNTLEAIINDIKSIHTTFSSPAVSVNAFNRSRHRDDLYFTVFSPDGDKPHWDGNFKRFKLTFDTNGNPVIVDKDDVPAISPITNFFKETATSFWTDVADAPDGNQTERGGAASRLTTSRNVYTRIGTSANLADASNEVHENNALLTNTVLNIGAATVPYRQDLLQWTRGIDLKDADGDGSTSDARRFMGDPLHGQPALIQYGGTEANPDITAYVVTNDGYLHAINTSDGTERFAFIPPELLPNLDILYRNTGTQKTYGLDGTVKSYVIDNDKDGVIESAQGDRVYIFVGMRRGGRNYYALDVTDRSNPELMWTIRGGINDPALGDYTELGQTWSAAQIKKMRYQGNDLTVMIVGGGYDTNQDFVNVRTADSMGRGIFIINALTGELIFRIGPDAGADLQLADMQYSIPSDVNAIDANGDTYLDHIYVGDMGGQLWRVDVDRYVGDDAGVADLGQIITGGRIADLADNTAISNRRFYYAPELALMRDTNKTLYIAIAIGSGYRAHPTSRAVQDRLFMLRDLPVFSAPSPYVTVTENDSTHELFDTTDNLIGQGTDTQIASATESLQNSNGWFIDLDYAAGEKALSKGLIFAGELFFTTFEPHDPTSVAASCTPHEGSGYLYHVNLDNGTPVKNYDLIVNANPDELTKEDRRVKTNEGISGDPTTVHTDQGDAVCTNTNCRQLGTGGEKQKLYWYEQ